MIFELLGTMVGVGWQGFLIAALAPEGATIAEQQRAYLIAAVAVVSPRATLRWLRSSISSLRGCV